MWTISGDRSSEIRSRPPQIAMSGTDRRAGGHDSVGRRVIAMDVPPRADDGTVAPGVDPRPLGGQAPPAGPLPQPLHRLAGRHRHRHDVRRGLDQRDVQQGRQPAARPDLGAGPVAVLRAAAGPGRARTCAMYIFQIVSRSCGPGRSRKKTPSNRSARASSGGSFEMSLAEADDEHVGLVVAEPGQQRAEHPGGDAAVARCRADAAERLLDLVDHDDARRHRVDDPQGLADVRSRSDRPASPSSEPTSSIKVGRPVSLPSAFATRRFSRTPAARAGARRGAGHRPAAPAAGRGCRTT